MRAPNKFDFDQIACPNSFDDDPEIDAFFDRIIHCSKREVLRKTAIFKNKTSIRSSKIALAESTKRNIQKRTQSFREKFLPEKKTKAVEIKPEEKGPIIAEQTTPVSQIVSKPPLNPPRTKRMYSRLAQIRNEPNPNQDCVKRHAWGRWSFPPAVTLIYSVDPEDVRPAQATPLRPKKTVDLSSRIRTSSYSCVTPKRKKSVAKATKIRFEPRESLRKISLRKSLVKKPKPSRIPVARKPYPKVKDKVDEALRAVLPKKTHTNNPSVNMTSSKRRRPLENFCLPPRNPNPNGKTLAQLAHEFQKFPREFRVNPKDKRAAWKNYF